MEQAFRKHLIDEMSETLSKVREENAQVAVRCESLVNALDQVTKEKEDLSKALIAKEDEIATIRDNDISTMQDSLTKIDGMCCVTGDRTLNMLVKDATKTMLSRISGDPVVDKDTPVTDRRREIPISDFLLEKLGRPATLKEMLEFGREVATAFRLLRGREPPKREQWVDGTTRRINSYSSQDVDVLDRAVKEWNFGRRKKRCTRK